MTPFKGNNRVISIFGWRTSPITGARQHHNGIDIVAPNGDWNVRECSGGKVIEVSIGYNFGRGNLVRVQAGNAVETYQHMKSISVKKDQNVPQGTILGVAGTTGDSTGVHLHFEVTRGGVALNPSQWADIPNIVGTYPGNDNLTNTDPNTSTPIGVGSVIQFVGGPVYASSQATQSTVTRPASKCLVTAFAESALRPYHCISQDGKGIYGWVNAKDIGAQTTPVANMYNVSIGPMSAGDKNYLESESKRLGLSINVTEVG